MQQSWGPATLLKRDSNTRLPVNVPKVFKFCFSIRKEFLKSKVSGEIAFELISLFHVQIQEPTSRSTTMRAFAFLAKFAEFYYHKIFETRSWWRPKRLRGWT